MLVKFREDVMDLSTDLGADTLTMMTQVLQVQSVEMLEQENTVLLTSDTKYSSLERIFGITERSTTDELMDKLQDDPRVESVQPNFIYYPSSLPDDPSFSSQWNLYNTLSTGSIRADIHYTEAMDFMKSTSLQATPTIIAVLDMGVAYDHPDLKNMMWDGSNCVTDTGAYLG